MKVALHWCGVQPRCWRLVQHVRGSHAKPVHKRFWRIPSLQVSVGLALPHTVRHEAKAGTLSALAQINLNNAMCDRNPVQNKNIQGVLLSRYRCEPVYPCTVSGGGACLAGVSLAVAISAQDAPPQSSHTH